MGLLLEIGAIGAWIVILITGKMPRGLFDMMVLANSYCARSDSYLYLLTETYPPFQDEQTRAAGSAGCAGPLALLKEGGATRATTACASAMALSTVTFPGRFDSASESPFRPGRTSA